MDRDVGLAALFEEHRSHLRAVAYRMLGSHAEVDDAVQEAWLRLSRSDDADIRNLGGWLTTVVARICLDMLRSRRARREEPYEVHIPDPTVSIDTDVTTDPAAEVVHADSVGLAMLVVLDSLAPRERLAFVLHDVFGVPFAELAGILECTPAAAKQLAHRARQRVRGAPTPDADVPRQREVVAAFLAATRDGDFDALLAVLDPDVVLRADAGSGAKDRSRIVRGDREVAGQVLQYAALAWSARPATVNGTAGAVAMPHGRLVAVLGTTIRDGRIVEIDILADAERLSRIVAC
jgi:RNA polymerase sigma factor (sigma-70 family)